MAATPNEIRNKSLKFSTLSSTVSTKRSTVNSKASSINNSWKGSASQEFANCHKECGPLTDSIISKAKAMCNPLSSLSYSVEQAKEERKQNKKLK